VAALKVKSRWVPIGATALGVVLVAGVLMAPRQGQALPDNWLAAEAKALEHETAIAECMGGRGWEYVAALPLGVIVQREIVRAESRGLPPPDPSEVALPVDPNHAIVARLDDEAKEARATAFWGDLDVGGSDPGCYALTYEDIWGVDLLDPSLDRHVQDLEAFLAADSRVVDAERGYISCMASHGLEVSSRHQVLEEYVLATEQLGERGRREGDSPELDRAWEALWSSWEVAVRANDECFQPFYLVEESVRAEYLRMHGIWED
jgi:hypothetical protein